MQSLKRSIETLINYASMYPKSSFLINGRGENKVMVSTDVVLVENGKLRGKEDKIKGGVELLGYKKEDLVVFSDYNLNDFIKTELQGMEVKFLPITKSYVISLKNLNFITYDNT